MPSRGPPLLPEAPDGFLAPWRTPPRRERAIARAPFKARLPRLASAKLPGVCALRCSGLATQAGAATAAVRLKQGRVRRCWICRSCRTTST